MAIANMSSVGLTTLALTVAALAFLGGVHTAQDAVTNYVMTTDTATTGPEAARCIGTGICYGQKLTCPNTCKQRSTIGPGQSACFIDCQACKTSCKHRTPDCFGYGAVCYDPRFIGGDGIMFYFHGKKDKDFCLVSDERVHINAHFIGKRPEGRSRDYTWVQALGMLFDSHQLSVAAKTVATWSDDIDQLVFSYDGEEVVLPEVEGAVWTSPSGEVVIERTENVNSVRLVIDQLLDVLLHVAPITAEESRVHNYQITEDNCFAHLQMQFNFLGLSASVNGVLGQTYQPGFKNPVKVGVPMPIMGGEDKFLSSSLFSSDCKVTEFSAATFAAKTARNRSVPTQCTNNGGGLICRR